MPLAARGRHRRGAAPRRRSARASCCSAPTSTATRSTRRSPAGVSAYLSKSAPGERICDAIAAVARGEVILPAEVQAGLAAEIRLRSEPGRPALSPREQEVLRLIAEGLSAPAVGRELHLSHGHGEVAPQDALREARRQRPRRRRGRGDAPRPARVARSERAAVLGDLEADALVEGGRARQRPALALVEAPRALLAGRA